jgi:hypothetical protein
MSWMIAPGEVLLSVTESVAVFSFSLLMVIVGLTPHSLMEVQLFNKTIKSMTDSSLIGDQFDD